MWPFPQVSQCLSPGMSSGCLNEAPLSNVYLGQLSQISSSRDFGQIMATRQRMCFCDCLPSGSYLSSLFITSSWGGSAMPGRHGQYLFPGLWCIWPHCSWWATLLTGNIHPHRGSGARKTSWPTSTPWLMKTTESQFSSLSGCHWEVDSLPEWQWLLFRLIISWGRF